MEKDAATVLEEAADLLLIRGVCRNMTYGQPGEDRCAYGAISEVVGDAYYTACGTSRGRPHINVHPAAVALQNHVARTSAWLAVPPWNDHTDDDFEVIDTLRHVAKDLRNQAAAT